MKQDMELTNKDFKITRINMLKALMERPEVMSAETWNSKKVPEGNAGRQMNNASDGLVTRLSTLRKESVNLR